MLDNVALYDALYLLAADGGREAELFGDCQALARQAFERSLVGEAFPTIWFEVPLTGAPRFDLHVAIARESLVPGVHLGAVAKSTFAEVFRWYADEETGGNGLAFAYDVSDGSIDTPALHVNVNKNPLEHMERFFELVADKDAASRYADFTARLPQGWRVWYAGYHPGRPEAPVRVDCFVGSRLNDAYAAEPDLFVAHLQACGFSAVSDALLDIVGLVTRSPYHLELQFDVLEGGRVGDTIGVSAGFGLDVAQMMLPQFDEGGAAHALLSEVEARGLADARWHAIQKTLFTRFVNDGEKKLALYDVPTFIKLRLRDGQLLDAKMYLQAGAKLIG